MVALPQLAAYRAARDTDEAAEQFRFTAARARAAAIESDQVVVLLIRAAADSVVVRAAGGAGDLIEAVDYGSSSRPIDLVMESEASSFSVCYVAGGYAHPTCGDGERLVQGARVGFVRYPDTAWVTITGAGNVREGRT